MVAKVQVPSQVMIQWVSHLTVMLRNSNLKKCYFLALFLAAIAVIYFTAANYSLPGLDPEDQRADKGLDVLIYNRIPKTGSTTFVKNFHKLGQKNGISVVPITNKSSFNKYTLTLKDQMMLSRNMTRWHKAMPALYHGHFAYFNLKIGDQDGTTRIKWINVIRRPIDRLVSFYYFLRYGDNLYPNKIRSRMGDKTTFDHCVRNQLKDCDPVRLWFQVPWFCGHFRRCWSPPGNSWALQQAKNNLVNNYFLVGVTEELDTFLNVLEFALPGFFRGAADLMKEEEQLHLRKTVHKDEPSDETLKKLKATDVWKAENEFYEFALSHFKAIAEEYKKSVNSFNKEYVSFDKVKLHD